MLPAVSGTAQVGQTLSTTNGTWQNSPNGFSYQWQACSPGCSNISAATGQTYIPVAGDVGKTIQVVVTATNNNGSTPATSNQTAAVTAPAVVSPTFVRHLVQLGAYDQVTKSTTAGDMNGDGSPDIVVAGADYLVWYQNPDWTPHLIAVGEYGEGASVVLRDLNGDGRVDVITGEISGPAATRTEVWFENTPTGWVRHVLSAAAYCHDLLFGDLNGDGTVTEAMCDDEIHAQIVTLTPSADPSSAWTVGIVDPSRDSMGSAIVDIDGDGRLDIVAGRAWYRNTGVSPWPRYAYTNMTAKSYAAANGVVFDDYERLAVTDLNGDGRPDIVASLFTDTPDGQLYVFLAPSDPITGAWTPVQIDAGPALVGAQHPGCRLRQERTPSVSRRGDDGGRLELRHQP